MTLNIDTSFAKSFDTSVINRPSVGFNAIFISTRFDVMFGPSYDGIVVHTFKNKVGEYLERMARYRMIESSLIKHVHYRVLFMYV